MPAFDGQNSRNLPVGHEPFDLTRAGCEFNVVRVLVVFRTRAECQFRVLH